MARTPEGRELTEAHKLAQVALGARFAASSRLLLGELSATRLDATLPDWLALQVLLAEAEYAASADMATAYLAEFRTAEVSAAAARRMPVNRPTFDAGGFAARASVIGPMAKAATAEGVAAQAAVDAAFWRLVGGWGQWVLAGGRDLVDRSALANPASVGWRRVADSDPCAWCAMLAGRGAAYTSASNAGMGRKYHPRCGCTAEEVFEE